MKGISPKLLLALLATVSFTLATSLEWRVSKWTDTSRPDGALAKLLGEGRRLFANQFITMADVYLHSGYYPSIFDQREGKGAKAVMNGEVGERGSGKQQGHDA